MTEKQLWSMKVIVWCAIGILLTLLIGLACGEIKVTPIKYVVTAYCPGSCCCGRWADGYTASGYKIKPGDRFVAAPRQIPFGTKVIIPGYNNNKPVKVLDRGGAIKGNKLDVFFDTHKEALRWGRQSLKVRIL